MLTRARRQDGFTLIELMVTITLSMLVLFALMTLIDTGGKARARIGDKTESVQRLRNGMDRITRILRTQVCADTGTPPLISGTASAVTFYSDMQSSASSSAFRPRKVELAYTADDNGSIVQKVWEPTNTVSPWTYPDAASPTRANTLIDNVTAEDGTNDVFSYYAFDAINTPLALPLNTSLAIDPLPVNSVARVTKIGIDLKATPQSRNTGAGRSTAITNTVHTRNADFSGGDNVGRTWGPRCG